MIKTLFNLDNEPYTILAIVNLTTREIEVIYQLEYNDDIDFGVEVDPYTYRLDDINRIIKFHNMTKVNGINYLLAASIHSDTNNVYLLIDNFSGYINWDYYQKMLVKHKMI